jgi:hypothetical protein
MNAATLLNELYSREVALLVVGPNRLRFEAREHSLNEELLLNLREHKLTILAILGKEGSTAKLLGRRCPFCLHVGMKIEETRKDELQYFDTRCTHCDEIVETLVADAMAAEMPVHELPDFCEQEVSAK